MIQALLNEIYFKTKLKPFQETDLKGVFLGALVKGQDSSYETYYKENNAKKENPFKPIKQEVIDFIVDSFVVKEGKFKGHLKERLKKGLYQINQTSLTGRALIKRLRHGQIIDATQGLHGSIGCVYGFFDVIFIDKELHHKRTPFELALSLLHESEHVIDGFQMRPIFEKNIGYFNKNGEELKDNDAFYSARHEFSLDRLFEAEKHAQGYQILAERMGGFKFLMGIASCLSKAYNDFCQAFLFSLVYLFQRKKKAFNFSLPPAKENQVAVLYKIRLIKNEVKAYLKNPKSLFSQTKRHQIKKKAALQSMADHILFLIHPNKKMPSFGLMKNTILLLFSGLGVSAFLGNPFFSLLGLVGAGLMNGIYFSNKYYYQSREAWCHSYNKSAYKNSRRMKAYEQSSAKRYRLILKAFQHKYHGLLQKKELEKSQTDIGEFEEVLKSKEIVDKLPEKLKTDVIQIAEFQAKYPMNESQNALPDWWVHELVLKAFLLKRQNKKFSFERAIKEMILMRLHQTDIFDRALREAPLEAFLKLEMPSLKEAFLKKRKEFKKEAENPYSRRQIIVRSQKEVIKRKREKGHQKGHQR